MEIQQKHCKVCGQLKSRIACGKFGDGRSKRWLDENGKQWNGLMCPDCQRNRARSNMERLRLDKKLDNYDE